MTDFGMTRVGALDGRWCGRCIGCVLAVFASLTIAAEPSGTKSEAASPQGEQGENRPSASLARFLLHKAEALFRGEPQKYARVISRGGSLRDGVVQLSDGTADLSLIVRRLQPGNYNAELIPIPYAGKGAWGKVVGPIAFRWNPPAAARVSAADLSPGLHELALVEDFGGTRRRIGTAWIFVAHPSSYEKVSAAYEELRAILAARADLVEPDRLSLLRASLEALAQNEDK